MAQLDHSREALLRLIERLKYEMGETAISNFALDVELTAAQTYIGQMNQKLQELGAENAAIRERMAATQRDNETLREQLDEKRKGRFRGANEAKPV